MAHPSLPDASKFQIELGPSDYIDKNLECYEIYGRDKSRFFTAAFAFGFNRATGNRINPFTVEPDVLYISDVDATEGHGLGSLVTSLAIEEAKKREINIGRLGIINSRMVKVIERLTNIGIVKERYYRLAGAELQEQPSTANFELSSDLVDFYIAENKIDNEVNTYVDCVIRF